jgi:hypothetical protein
MFSTTRSFTTSDSRTLPGDRIPERSRTAARPPSAPRSYWRASRAHRYSLIFALPLLVFYETLAALLSYGSGGIRNGADVLIKSLFIAIAGTYGPLLFAAVVIGISIWLIRRDMRANGRSLQPAIFGGMMIESLLLAIVFGALVGGLTAKVLAPFAIATQGPLGSMGWGTQLMVSLGAGIYEELLFRVVLVSALAFFAQRVLSLRTVPAGVFAVIGGAFIFSAFHYIGPYGDPLEAASFVFRMIGGMVFSAMYLLRGFGITAWTHALYDVMVLVVVF